MFDPFEGLPPRVITPFDKIITWMESVKNKTWNWVWNPRCKYITLRIDARSGVYRILDRDGSELTEDELFYQFKKDSVLPKPQTSYDAAALEIARDIASQYDIADNQTIARLQLAAIEGLKKANHSDTIDTLVDALKGARGWLLNVSESPTGKKDLARLDAALDLVDAEFPCTCLSELEDDAYGSGGPMSGKRKPPLCKALVHRR